MNRKQYRESWQISKYILWGCILCALLGLNYWYLNRYLSSNTGYVTDFTPQEDTLSDYRHPLVAGVFYAIMPVHEINKSENEIAGHFENIGNYRPKILILPTTETAYANGNINKAYSLLQRYTKSINNIILLGVLTEKETQKAYLLNKKKVKTPSGYLSINQKIIKEFSESGEPFSINNHKFTGKTSLELQYPYIQKALPKAKIIPMLISGEVSESLIETLQKQIQPNNNLLIISADLIKYHGEDIEKNNSEGVMLALELAGRLNYHPQMFELIGYRKENDKKLYDNWDFYAEYDKENKISRLERERQNLKSFASQYRNNLRQIAQTALDKATLGKKEYSPSRRSFPEDIFDKGATYITLYKNGKIRGQSGSIIPISSVAQNISDNIYRVAIGETSFPPVEKEELPEIKIVISLLSNFERISYENELDLLKKLNIGKDGLVIRDGNRQGVSLPAEWESDSNPLAFLKKLKIKAGMNPNYWNNRINVYRFRTVEIKNGN